MDDRMKEKLANHCLNLEKTADELTARYEALLSGVVPVLNGSLESKDTSGDAECQKLMLQNKKLAYRIQILNRSIAEMTEMLNKQRKTEGNSSLPRVPELPSHHMCAILRHLEAMFVNVVRSAYPEYDGPPHATVQLGRMADYQCNAAMALAKVLKQNPRTVGETLVRGVKELNSPLIADLSLSGPGFINITLSTDFIREQITLLVTNGVTPPPVEKKRVAVDFSSPNIAKEMHVGHLRSTIIGESICRLLEFLGHDVKRINHLGDWGTQFGMLIAHLQDRFPDYLSSPPPISNLQEFYKESKARFDEDNDFKKRAYEAVVKLQAHEPDHMRGWRLICDISMTEFNKVYERLGVTIESFGESFYQSRMEEIVKELDERELLSLEDGRKVMYAEGATVPLTVVKSDGGFTYDTSDLACIKYRVQELGARWLIYVTDAGQQQHFKSFLACAQRAGIYDPAEVRVDHVTFGVVLGEDRKKFKTRSGDTVRLASLLDEGLARATTILREKSRHEVLTDQEFDKARNAVAYGCVKYADLSHDRTRDYVFSFDRMLDFRGNTAAYLLYALTRICSIARTAEVSCEALREAATACPVVLNHEKEWKLARTLLRLPDLLIKLSDDLFLHPLCEFLYEVSTVFSEFYDNCYCVEKDSAGTVVQVHINRLVLCEATAVVFKQCFTLLGINTVDKM